MTTVYIIYKNVFIKKSTKGANKVPQTTQKTTKNLVKNLKYRFAAPPTYNTIRCT